MRVLCCCALVCVATGTVSESSSRGSLRTYLRESVLVKGPEWSIQGKRLLKDGSEFFIKGLNYQPIPVGGADYGDDKVGYGNIGDYLSQPWSEIYKRDIPNLRSMGVNVVKNYFFWRCAPLDNTPIKESLEQCQEYLKTNDGIDHTEFLDTLWNSGQDPIFMIIPVAVEVGNTLANPDSASMQDYRDFYQWVAKDLMATYGSHPAVLGVMIGNELNQKNLVSDPTKAADFWQALTDIKNAAVEGFKMAGVSDPEHTRVISTALQHDPAFTTYTDALKNYEAIFNVLTVNPYEQCGVSEDTSVFGQYAKSTLPMLLGEWGIPNSNSKTLLPDNAKAVADYITCYYNNHILKHQDITLGSFYFEYSDEWWKLKGPTDLPWVQDLGSLSSDPKWNEEAFGLYSIKPDPSRPIADPWNKNLNAAYPPDILTPLAGVEAFKNLVNPHP